MAFCAVHVATRVVDERIALVCAVHMALPRGLTTSRVVAKQIILGNAAHMALPPLRGPTTSPNMTRRAHQNPCRSGTRHPLQ